MKCARCTYFLDALKAAIANGDVHPGDLTVCVNCGACLVIDESFQQRIASTEDLAKVDRAAVLLIGELQCAIHIERKRRLAVRN